MSPGSDSDPHSQAEKAERLAAAFRRAINDGDLDSVEEYHYADVAFNPSMEEGLDRDDLKATLRQFLTAFPDLEVTIEDQFTDDDLACVRYYVTGTHVAPFRDIPPTNEQITAKGIGMARYDGEKIAEFTLVFDNLGMLEDMGLIG